jgi:hypothetical protein
MDTNIEERTSAEVVAHTVLRLIADMPGYMGRMRVARVVGGYAVRSMDDELLERLSHYTVAIEWTLRDAVDLVDALLCGGLIAQTMGVRSTLVLTRAGFRALEVLDAGEKVEVPRSNDT